MLNECQNYCKPKCESINLDSKVEITEKGSTETILEFIPIKSKRIGYTETLKKRNIFLFIIQKRSSTQLRPLSVAAQLKIQQF
jgi:hypothetical protein